MAEARSVSSTCAIDVEDEVVVVIEDVEVVVVAERMLVRDWFDLSMIWQFCVCVCVRVCLWVGGCVRVGVCVCGCVFVGGCV